MTQYYATIDSSAAPYLWFLGNNAWVCRQPPATVPAAATTAPVYLTTTIPGGQWLPQYNPVYPLFSGIGYGYFTTQPSVLIEAGRLALRTKLRALVTGGIK